MSKTYTSKVVEVCDNGDVIIELSDELLQEVGWKTDDTVEIKESNGEVYLTKVNSNE